MENLNLTPTPLDTSLATSSSTADGNIIKHECDVFITYRATDVRKTLASHLYHSLLSHGLRVFQAPVVMQMGDLISQIEGAIATAPVQIAIFSPGYADSRSCRRELVLMWKRKSSSMFLPVFYKVHPTELRRRGDSSMFGRCLDIFREKGRDDDYTIDEWSEALYYASEVNGFVLEECNNDEGKLVKNIVERVLKKLKNHLCYDVFINHRGPDVKKTLASHIYYALIAHGLRVFLDIEELQQGESLNSQIERAIGTSFVHIAIFSPHYAESNWCLEELVLMFQSTKTIIPVFTGVTPSGLMLENLSALRAQKTEEEKPRYDNETLAKGRDCLSQILSALRAQKTEEEKPRYDNETLAKWRDCLSQITLAAGKPHSDGKEGQVLSGFDLGECEGDEGELVDRVVKRVLQEEARRF